MRTCLQLLAKFPVAMQSLVHIYQTDILILGDLVDCESFSLKKRYFNKPYDIF